MTFPQMAPGDWDCCMDCGCLLPESCTLRGYCRLSRDGQRRERADTRAKAIPSEETLGKTTLAAGREVP